MQVSFSPRKRSLVALLPGVKPQIPRGYSMSKSHLQHNDGDNIYLVRDAMTMDSYSHYESQGACMPNIARLSNAQEE